MAKFVGGDDTELINLKLSEIGGSLTPSFQHQNSSFRGNSTLNNLKDDDIDEECASQVAAIERFPTVEWLESSSFGENDGNEANPKGKQVVDVTKLGASEKHMFIEKLIKHIEPDNLQLLQKIRKRIDKVGIELPTVEVRYHNLHVEAECEVVYGKPIPTLWNSFKRALLDLVRLPGLKSQMSKISIIDGVSGVIKPGRMTLLLGPPSCGKTTLLKALSGNFNKSFKVTGDISCNGYKLTEFVPQKTTTYISQSDLHIPEMTVRETLDFSSLCQGIGCRAEIVAELSKREKEAGILPDPDIDTFMKAISVQGQNTLLTDYILKILGLDICADTFVGDAMRRGVSGGQKKRLTIGEMIVGPAKVLFMDEISNGLDNVTTYQVISCFQHLAHILDATILISLLQPSPETFDLFDDIIVMAQGKIVYHGPRSTVLEFLESCGFRCPERKGVADFLQEVISIKDQVQYWNGREDTYTYISVDALSRKFKESYDGKKLNEQLSAPLIKSQGQKDAITVDLYSYPKLESFRACMSREFLLMKKNSFVYIFKIIQLLIIASIIMTVFSQRRMDIDILHANYYMGALFYSLAVLILNGLPELSMTVARLEVFYKQRDLYFYPAWAYAIPSVVLKVPLSMLEAIVWTCLTYYVIGYTPEVGRFFRQLILLFAIHSTSISMFRFLASVCRTMVASTLASSLSVLFISVFGGFLISRTSIPIWLKWGFWVSPVAYGEIGLAINEFLAPRWQKILPTNVTIGKATLESRGLDFDDSLFWISIGALFGFSLIFNIGFTLALSFLHPIAAHAIISNEKFSQMQRSNVFVDIAHVEEKSGHLSKNIIIQSRRGEMVLPFEPLSVVFQDIQYYVDIPKVVKEQGVIQKKLQLLCDITGTFRPGVLTALMGVSGAGKTTLLDVLCGRKTSGTIEGEIKIGGFQKVQKAFARISGYCEQNDIHSPQLTVEESIIFSAWLRLHPQIDSKSKSKFVKEVLETIELEDIKDALVGVPGVSGLSTEQRKRLTIAVELVANPSIFFLDEPTTGLDARAAAIVMRAVKNVADAGRTIVCTIHQPSTHIFEAFDELILLKTGGRMIYSGPIGWHSNRVIEYFEGISGVPKIKSNYNPATWMLEVTSTSLEAELGIDFAEIYQNSTLHEDNKEFAKRLSYPPLGSKPLDFPTSFPQNGWGQFKVCLWKQYWSYWRSPSYNLRRFLHMLIASLVFGGLFWHQGKKLIGILFVCGALLGTASLKFWENEQSLFNVIGSMFSAILFCGINNSSSVLPYVSTERVVFYRERFSGMYTSLAYALAQVTIEIPYIFAQTLVFTVITYPMIGYYWSAYKIFWYLYSMFCTFLYFNYLGMVMVSMTPSFQVVATIQSAFYIVLNLFAGFLIPQPKIPKWWSWLYYLSPTSWTLNAMVTSQYGDINQEIKAFGETKTVAAFLRAYFGFHRSQLPIVALVLVLYPVAFASIFAFCIGNLNFQKR